MQYTSQIQSIIEICVLIKKILRLLKAVTNIKQLVNLLRK